MSAPDRRLELSLGGVVCGIDEVGRGCLAGPVVAAAVALPAELPDALLAVRDSKRLSARRREALGAAIRASCAVGLGVASAEEVDGLDVLRASFLAMRRALAALPVRPAHAIVDGNAVPPGLGIPATAVVGGDGLVLAVAAASVVAKVHRDAAMAALDLEHPGYGWARNAGYGTPEHLAGLAARGPTPHHRRTFGGVRELLAPPAQMSLGF